MFLKLLWLAILACVNGDSPAEFMQGPSFLRPFNEHASPRTHWSYGDQVSSRLQDDSRRLTSEEVSHAYALHPYHSFHKATGSSSDHPRYPFSFQDYWRGATVNTNHTSTKSYNQSGLQAGGGAFYQDPVQGSQSTFQYQQIRGTTIKKLPSYFPKGKLQVQSAETSGKPKYKKTFLYHAPSNYKKTLYPRVHKPYAKHKYPTHKTIHPFYRRYYQSPYQQYSIPANEILQQQVKTQSGYAETSAAYPTTVSNRHHTTERIDDAFTDGPTTSEDYSVFNDTYGRPSANYYEAYEEVDKTTIEPEENSYDDTTTRGYYGDRIYMSTQVPIKDSDKFSMKNKYFLVRRTSSDDDIETIFE